MADETPTAKEVRSRVENEGAETAQDQSSDADGSEAVSRTELAPESEGVTHVAVHDQATDTFRVINEDVGSGRYVNSETAELTAEEAEDFALFVLETRNLD